ncbi:MAG: hypothetical protein C0179_05680 [Fervidicoccus sp.]|nr:MAG: hypothetical protein C0179_05680 [Fervidicoccus sp.]
MREESHRGIALSKRPWILLLSTTLASSLVPFLSSSVSVALPAIAESVSISISKANWVNNSFLIPLAASVLIAGRIGDWWGRGRVYLLGLLMFVASSALILVPSNDFHLLLLTRAFQGISGAFVTSVAVSLLSEAFPPNMRGRVIGINTMAVYVGLSLGPMLGGALTSFLGWRSIFLFSLVISALSLSLALRSVDIGRGSMNPPKAPESAVFLASTALIATGTSLMAIPVAGAGLVALGTAAFIALLLFEKRRGALIHPALLRPRLVMSYSAAMLNYSATFALTVLLSLYLENMKGMTPFEAGMVLTIQPVIQAALSPVAGFMAEKVDPSMIATIGMGIIAYGIFSLIPVISINRISLLYASLALLGIGFALFASPNTTAVVSLTPREAYASSLAFLATMRYFGQALSTSVIISVESLISSIESSIFVSLEIYVTLSIIGTILSYLARKR